MALQESRIIVAVTGGIAAYKAAELCSLLRKSGALVRVAMTQSAEKFVAPLTFEALTGYPVYQSVLDEQNSYEMEHISWAKWGEALIVAPATANVVARMACGIADDPVTTLYLSFAGPVFVAPSMNTHMLQHPATQANLQTLKERGVVVIEPDTGMLACGDIGPGKLASPERIVQMITDYSGGFGSTVPAHSQATMATRMPPLPALPKDNSLEGRKVLITSGPTHEYLDPVRFLTNPSSGKMGLALAREAARRGAEVHFVTGPVSPSLLPNDTSKVYRITAAEQMLRSVEALAPDMDIMIFAAAVSDFRFAHPVGQKIKRTGNSLTIPLLENPDIAQAVGHMKQPGQVTVGFAAETEDMEEHALAKLEKKKLDAIVANDVANPRIGFESDENEVSIFLRDGSHVKVSRRPKPEVAHEIFEAVMKLIPASA